jgi:hypothetical protein
VKEVEREAVYTLYERERKMSDAPAWVEGFHRAVAEYVVDACSTSYVLGHGSRLTELGTHMQTCSIAEVHDVDQEVEEELVFDTFDPHSSRAFMAVSVVFTCACGEYTRHRLETEASITDIIYSVTRSVPV